MIQGNNAVGLGSDVYAVLVNQMYDCHERELLSVQAFVKKTGFNIDALFIDEQWQMMNNERLDVLKELTTTMIKQIGFRAEDKNTLIKKLQNMYPSSDGKREYQGDGFNVVVEKCPVTGSKTHGGKRYEKRIMMTKHAYKKLIMTVNTSNADRVRESYICLEELFIHYLLYQKTFQEVRLNRQNDLLGTENRKLQQFLTSLGYSMQQVIEQNNEMKHAVDRQTQMLDKITTVMTNDSEHRVLPLSDNNKKQALVVLRNRSEPETVECRRGQEKYIKRVISKKRRNGEDVEIVAKVDKYMNPLNLGNRLAERISGDERFQMRKLKVKLNHGTTATDLANVLADLDSEKKANAVLARQTFTEERNGTSMIQI